MSEKILVQATRTRACPSLGYGKSALIRIEAKAYQLGGNKHPHFSVTCAIGTPRELQSGDWQAGGCMHEECLKYWPEIKPIIDLHLSNADDGEPMYAEANGFYHLAGCVAGAFGEQYHAGNSERHFPCTPPADKPWQNTECRKPTFDECLTTTAEYLRCSVADIEAVRDSCVAAFKAGADTVASSPEVSPMAEKARCKAGNVAAKAAFKRFVDSQRERWAAEAKAGLELIQKLAATQS